MGWLLLFLVVRIGGSVEQPYYSLIVEKKHYGHMKPRRGDVIIVLLVVHHARRRHPSSHTQGRHVLR